MNARSGPLSQRSSATEGRPARRSGEGGGDVATGGSDYPRRRLTCQHVDVRLTGEDGYQAQRSYSIASEPSRPTVAITIERLDGGEVYLTDALGVGDRLELRGPIGGYFVWESATGGPTGGPLFLVAGGSGIVPLMAMLRTRAAANPLVREADLRVRCSNRADERRSGKRLRLNYDAAFSRDLVNCAVGQRLTAARRLRRSQLR